MAKKEGYLFVAQPENIGRQVFLVRSLVNQSQAPKPCVHTGRMRAVAIAAKHQLMPLPPAFMPVDADAESALRSMADRLTVGFRCGSVPDWLVLQVATVAGQVGQQQQMVFVPMDRPAGFG